MVEIKEKKEVEEVEELIVVKEQKLGNKLTGKINEINYLHNYITQSKIRMWLYKKTLSYLKMLWAYRGVQVSE